MEETKTTNPSTVKNEERKDTPGCLLWIFGDEDSADNDLKQKFEIVDDEENTHHGKTI